MFLNSEIKTVMEDQDNWRGRAHRTCYSTISQMVQVDEDHEEVHERFTRLASDPHHNHAPRGPHIGDLEDGETEQVRHPKYLIIFSLISKCNSTLFKVQNTIIP